MRKFWNFLTTLLLIVLVLTSIGLSFLFFYPSLPQPKPMMTDNDFSFTYNERRDLRETTRQAAQADLNKIFRATQAVRYEQGRFQVTRNQDLLSRWMEPLPETLAADNLTPIGARQAVVDFQIEAAQQPAYMELVFESAIPLAVFQPDGASAAQAEDRDAERYQPFNRLTYLPDEQAVYLINDEADTAYGFALAHDPLSYWWDAIDTVEFTPVEQVVLKNSIAYLPTEPSVVPLYRYIIEQQAAPDILGLFFGSAEEIHDYSDAFVSRYFVNDRSLLIDNNTLEVQYKRSFQADSPETVTIESARNLHNLYAMVQDWRYFGASEEPERYIFRQAVDGIPIYGAQSVSTFFVDVYEPAMVNLHFSALSIQTPVSDLARDYQLPAGTDVLAALNAAGYARTDLDGLSIGYFWRQSTVANRLIDLIPTWVVAVDGEWHTLGDLVDVDSVPGLATELVDEASDDPDVDVQLQDHES